MARISTWYNLDDVIEELMEDMDDIQASNHEDNDIDDTWGPKFLQKECKQNADGGITSPKQYEKVNFLVNQLTRYSTF